MVQMGAAYENGIYRMGDVRLSDLSGRKILPIGNDDFIAVVQDYVFVDKSMLIADVLDSGRAATLFCRPRRFGKSLNLSMMQRFFEIPSPDDPAAMDTASLFEGLAIWTADGGRYREHHGAYPVIRFSLNNIKDRTWEAALGTLRQNIAAEFRRHGFLADSPRLLATERELCARAMADELSAAEAKSSLLILAQLLFKHYGRRSVILVDEYDAPVMAAHTFGYYDEAVDFLKGWLTGALKGSGSLSFAVLTGVQRISKESVFSDLNNLTVNTALSTSSDERYGFTEAEVIALFAYRRQEAGLEEARCWYDGYRFGGADVYNPWSVVNYLSNQCRPEVYWGNTSSNSVLADMVQAADQPTWEKLYRLLEPAGEVREPIDLSVVFPDAGIKAGALWSMLYLAGYLTTADVEHPDDTSIPRRLSIPNREVERLYRTEIIERFVSLAGGAERLAELRRSLKAADAAGVESDLKRILMDSASSFDLVSENSYHMLLLGLLLGMPGYRDPVSNRESGAGRFDIQLIPEHSDRDPLITIELKYAKPRSSEAARLGAMAVAAVRQIDERAYDEGGVLLPKAASTVRWGIAFSGKSVAVACE